MPLIAHLMGNAFQQYITFWKFFMGSAGFLLVIATGSMGIIISMALDFLWAQALPVRFYFLCLPCVVVHECAPMPGCLLIGAKLRTVVLFSREGGSVTYSPQ